MHKDSKVCIRDGNADAASAGAARPKRAASASNQRVSLRRVRNRKGQAGGPSGGAKAPQSFFKVGDKVKCVDDFSTSILKAGRMYKVFGQDSGGWLRVADLDGVAASSGSWNPKRFRLAEGPKRAGRAKPDLVNHPPHYKAHPSGVECITVTEHFNFNLGNAIKYIWRSGEKGAQVEDLKKAAWYLAREIARLEK